mmetsp:Transcript_1201/g.1826  ORF Transcript_1201/g.1826 Transcript_1201/m.1826 type:complete len:219 (-) Transcript_1201:335-991(-)
MGFRRRPSLKRLLPFIRSTIRMTLFPLFLLFRTLQDVRRQTIVVILMSSLALLVLSRGFTFLEFSIVSNAMASRLKVNEDVREESTLEGEGSTVQDGMTLIEHHFTRFHGNIVRLTIMSNNLQRPRFIHILRHINNRRANQWQSIDMTIQNRILLINPNSIQGRGHQIHPRPFRYGAHGRIPNGIHQFRSSTFQIMILHIDHFGLTFPIVDKGIPNKP